MQTLHQALQSRLKDRKLYRPAMALVIKRVLLPLAIDSALLRVRLQERTCTVFLGPAEDKTARFLQRATLLAQINKKLLDEGRELQIKELKISSC